jgi:hypothetical protein
MGHAVKSGLAVMKAETAAARAIEMLGAKLELPADRDGACLLPLHAVPAHVAKDSDLNRSWNFATLNLLEQVDDLVVIGRILRHVEVRRAGDRSSWARAKRNDETALAVSLVEEHLGRRNSVVLDLARVAKQKKVALLKLEGDVVRLALRRGIDLTPLDEDKGQAWVFVRQKRTRTWSRQHEQRLEEFRVKQLQEAARAISKLRSFVRARSCRLVPFAQLYGISFSGGCGHCDRCDPRLAYP